MATLFIFTGMTHFLARRARFWTKIQTTIGVLDSTNTDIQSDLGGSIGGPVYIPHVYDGRNKTFWFFSYDRYRQSFTPSTVTLPTQAELGGDFSAAFNPS